MRRHVVAEIISLSITADATAIPGWDGEWPIDDASVAKDALPDAQDANCSGCTGLSMTIVGEQKELVPGSALPLPPEPLTRSEPTDPGTWSFSVAAQSNSQAKKQCVIELYCGGIPTIRWFGIVHCWVNVRYCDGTHHRFDKWQVDNEFRKFRKKPPVGGEPLAPEGEDPDESNVFMDMQGASTWDGEDTNLLDVAEEAVDSIGEALGDVGDAVGEFFMPTFKVAPDSLPPIGPPKGAGDTNENTLDEAIDVANVDPVEPHLVKRWVFDCPGGADNTPCSKLTPEKIKKLVRANGWYFLFFLNSNAFAQTLIDMAGLDFSLPLGAIGSTTGLGYREDDK